MLQTITLDYNKIQNQIASIDEIARNKKWGLYYDEDLDSLYFSPAKIASNYSLFSVNNEYSVYVDKKSNVGGVLVEYYKSNKSSHDKRYKELADIFSKKVTDDIKTVPDNKEGKAELLSTVIKADLLSILRQENGRVVAIPA